MINRIRARAALLTLALAMVAVCVPRLVSAAIVYTHTIMPTFVATTSTDGNTNCVASEGCLGRTIGFFVVDDIPNALPDGVLPNVLIFNFPLSLAEQAAIKATAGIGTLIVTAARDIGLRQAQAGGFEPPSEWLDARFNDVMVGVGNELFKNVPSTCPFPHSEAAADLTCGPNFNTDVTSTALVEIPQALFHAAADFASIEIELDPTDLVARLKIQSVTLQYAAPEPAIWTLLLAGLLGLRAVQSRAAPGRA